MKSLIALIGLILLISCHSPKEQTDINFDNISYNQIPELNQAPTVPLEPYIINIRVDKTYKGEFILETFMHLYGGSHFVSPHSSERFKGRFSIALNDNEFLKLDEKFEEIPRSKEIHDPHPFVNGLVNWVSVDTKYKHELLILNEIDFKVKGWVTFTIEPRCTFEKIPFIVSYENGEMKIALENC